jgi:sirohydrochlorin ferrochelatase
MNAAPILLVAHGSRDPRAAASTRALRHAVAAIAPDRPVEVAYLDHERPTVPWALAAFAAAGHRSTVVVPLLLTSAYHGRVDLPELLAEARAAGIGVRVVQADVLGPRGHAVDAKLVVALRRRLRQLCRRYDALVLAAAGTRDPAARATVVAAASALGTAAGVPCVPAYASAAEPTPGQAVLRLRREGARRVAVAAYFLAPGLLYDRAVSSAIDAGAIGVAGPLGDAPELAQLVLARADVAASAGNRELILR